jgi:hypothetical protein
MYWRYFGKFGLSIAYKETDKLLPHLIGRCTSNRRSNYFRVVISGKEKNLVSHR